jgi:hypothetical protein
MKSVLRTVLAGCVLAFAASRVDAAARVFVSVNGNDANVCSNIATPCRTLNGGIAQVDAAGEVIVIDTGSFAGANVTKSVKINVPTGVVAFSASPITVAAAASDVVVLRGLTIKAVTPGTGVGVTFTSGAALYIENCVIDGWQAGIDIGTAGKVFITDSTVRNSALSGVQVSAAATVAVDLSRFEGNGPSSGGCGILIMNNGIAAVRDSVASGNDSGFCAIGTGAQLTVHNSIAANNTAGSGVIAGASGTARVGGSLVTANNTGLDQAGVSTFESLGNNLVEGNNTDSAGTITVVAGR